VCVFHSPNWLSFSVFGSFPLLCVLCFITTKQESHCILASLLAH
jgi:hypothetical protein